jgi:hypothetical protein
MRRFAARLSGLAFGLALAVRPARVGSGSAHKGGSRRCFLRSVLCEAVRKDLRVPLWVEGSARTMRGVPARCQYLHLAIGTPSSQAGPIPR